MTILFSNGLDRFERASLLTSFCSFQAMMNVEHLAPSVAGRRAWHDAISHGLVFGYDSDGDGVLDQPVVAVVPIRSTARLIAA